MAKKNNDGISRIYQDAVDNIRFLKEQQWKVTNYAALIYSAAFFASGYPPFRNSQCARVLLVLAIGFVCIFGILTLSQLQASIEDRFRPRVRQYYDDNDFTPGERKTYRLETSDKSDMIAWGLFAVCIAGAFLAAVLILASS